MIDREPRPLVASYLEREELVARMKKNGIRITEAQLEGLSDEDVLDFMNHYYGSMEEEKV